jgi:predicted TPR repeat methyltransferase
MSDVFEAAKQHFLQGLAQMQAGESAAAERSFEASLKCVPGRVSTLTNLGAVRVSLGKYTEALAVLEEAVNVDANNAPAWGYQGQALLALKRPAQALPCLARAVALEPRNLMMWLLRSEAELALDQRLEALVSLDAALAISPMAAQAWSNRGMLLRDLNRLNDAATSFERAIETGGDAQLNVYYLASLQGTTPANAPRAYVENLFDSYADDFAGHLVQGLNYHGHERLVARLSQRHPARFASVLEVGCGTGLCGALIRPLADRLHGLDISGAMVEKARLANIYDGLTHADALDFLRSAANDAAAQKFDLILAADVFNYVGELQPIFAASRAAMQPGGTLCFTVELLSGQSVENAESAGSATDMQLLPSLRYAHSEAYVRRAAEASGLAVDEIVPAPIREDQGVPIAGLLVFLSRPEAA